MNNTDEPVAALVVAAGSGSRLGAVVPKALVELDGVALVRRSVDAMVEGGVRHVVVTIPEGCQAAFERALEGVDVPLELVLGGQRRQDSVANGLAALAHLGPGTLVLVHDAARPLVPTDVVRGVTDAVRSGAEAVIPVVPVVDTVRSVQENSSSVVDRSTLRAVQTPQGFRLGTLTRAHQVLAADGLDVTDDAAACEACGHEVRLVDGHRDALKITEPIDLAVASAVLAGRH